MKIHALSRSGWSVVIVLVILGCASLFRLIDLENTPAGLHADEASYLLNTVSLLSSARDEDNQLLPISFHSLTDPKPALYSYLQSPFIALFGLSTASSRIPSAILGIFSLLVVYALFSRNQEKKLGILVLTVLAISPWHIVASRSTQEVIASFLFFCISLVALFQYMRIPRWGSYAVLCASATISMYMYHSAKIILPLFITTYIVILLKKHEISLKRAAMLVLGSMVALAISLATQNSSIRFQTLSILNSPAPQSHILEQTYAGTPLAPQTLLRIFYNKPFYYGREILIQYATYFSPNYLFFEWSEPNRYKIPFHGLIYLVELPLIILGLYITSKRPSSFTLPMVLLLVLSPIPAIATAQEIPSTIRSFVMILPLAYFTARGIDTVLELKSRQLKYSTILVLSTIYLISLGYFAVQFGIQQKVYQPWYRNLPYQRVVAALATYESQYPAIVVPSDLRPLYAYFALGNLIKIADLREQPLARFSNDYTIGKYSFTRKHCKPSGAWTIDTLYILESACMKELEGLQLETLEIIEYADGEPAYVFATYDQ